MRILLQICLVLTAYLAASSRAQSSAQSCQAGSIIPTDENAVEVGSNRVFLNREDPAECDGQVYGWHICRARGSNAPNPEVILAMYHRVSSLFTVVDGSYRELSVSDVDFEYNEEYDLECLDYILDPSEYFRVKREDVVGVCYEENSENRLELVVENMERELEILSTDSCTRNTARVSDQSPRTEVALLLSVYIDINECLLGEAMCHENATCSDVVGGENSYNCTCNPGFTGDGFSCVGYHILSPGNSEGVTEVSTGTDGGGSEGTTEVGTSSNDRPTSSNEGNVSITPPDNSKRRGQEDGSVVGAIVAAFVVVFLIIAVVVTSIIIYLSRQRIEQALGRTIDLRRVRASKRTDTLAKVPDEDHDYDYVTATGHPVDNEYETMNKTPLSALTSRAQTSSVVPASDYEVPVQSLPCKFDPPLKNSPQYEAMLSAPSVKLEVGKDTVSGKSSAYASLIQRTVEQHVYEALSPYQVPASKQESLYAQLSSYNIRNISREYLEFVSRLGTGQFGKVNKAVWTDGDEKVEVAVKTLTDSANTVKFLQEAAIMAQFKHPNILTLHGVVSAGEPKMIVLELMHNGELKSVVTGMRPTSEQSLLQNAPLKLLDFSKQVALGLHYLSCRGFVHRDLAARNILVSQNYVCKISDFGLSRDLAIVEDDIYVSRGGKIPLKWCAPEAIFHRKYSIASDVWSYGCVLYEIWSLGHKPFEANQTKQVMQLIKKGYRLPPPPGCPKMIYKLMIDTWHPKPSSRPQSREIVKLLLGNVEQVLAIPPEDVPADSQAAVLGAPLDRASHLYQDLQNTYKLEQLF